MDKGLIGDEKPVNPAAILNLVKMTKLAVVEVPPPPSTNHLFLTTKTRKRVKTPEYRSWLEQAIPVLALLKQPEKLPCKIDLFLIGNWNEQRDGDNVVKAVLDALVAAQVIPDDSLKYVRGVDWDYDPNEVDADPIIQVRFDP